MRLRPFKRDFFERRGPKGASPSKIRPTATMGELEKTRLRSFKRNFFRAPTTKGGPAPKIRPPAGSLRSDCRQGSKPAARRSAHTSIRVLDCVLAVASVLLGGSSRSSFLGSARWRFYEFSLVLDVMPFGKNRSTSPVLRNFSAKIQGRPLVVSFERFRKFAQKGVPS